MPEFAISALRAVIELIGWCLLGQGVLALLAGRGRQGNPIYRLFDLITRPPRHAVAGMLGRSPDSLLVGMLTLVLLFAVWVGLAIYRKFV